MAFQANALSDLCRTDDDFEGKFKEMIKNLKPSFTFPNLTRNMRNSENINQATQDVNATNSKIKVSNTIEKLPPPTTYKFNEEPIVIPVHANDFESNFQNILNEAVFNATKKTLMLHSENFKGKYLKSLFLKTFPKIEQETILQHDNHPNDATKEDLQDFLKNQKVKIGIFQSRFVTGMEGANVIYFHDAFDYGKSSVRCTMTRAVSHLCIILRFKDDDISTTFTRNRINNKFMKCKKIIAKGDDYFACLSCHIKQICFACLIACHQEHETEWTGYVTMSSSNMKCNCIISNCYILKD